MYLDDIILTGATKAQHLETLDVVLGRLEDARLRLKRKKCFQRAKELLLSAEVLAHYDPTKPIMLPCDASKNGLGAVLSHIMEDGTESPVGFAAKTLNAAEKNYSQFEKEGIAVMFVLKKFHKELYGRCFVIMTDHKPLLSLFGEPK